MDKPTKSKHAPRSPSNIDIHVGSRLRLRRQILKMSQEKLSERLDITFQQVQKYERGTNRVGASRLWKIAQILDVPINFFFEGLNIPHTGHEVHDQNQMPIVYDFINSSDGVALAMAVAKIKNKAVRRQILELARSLATQDDPT